MIKKISQSFIKDFRDYMSGIECGNIIREKYVNDRLLEDEEPGSMDLGSYFEYILTLRLLGKGSLPKNGKVPEPQYMVQPLKDVESGKLKKEDLTVKHMYDDYRKAHANVDYLVNVFHQLGMVVTRAAVKLTKGRFEGTLDLIVQCTKDITFHGGTSWKKGTQIIIDLKYSGLMGENTWKNKHGWVWSKIQKEYHGTQAKQYHYVGNAPFYFLVTQSNNKAGESPTVKLFHVPIDKFMLEQHIKEGNFLYDQFLFYKDAGFKPRPDFNKCNECQLREECKDRQLFPSVELVDLNVE